MSFSDCCRLCLKNENIYLSIFDHDYLQQKVLACVNIEVREYDKISQMLCQECFMKIQEYYEYRSLCQKTQFTLFNLLTSFEEQSNYQNNSIESIVIDDGHNFSNLQIKQEMLPLEEPPNLENCPYEYVDVCGADFENSFYTNSAPITTETLEMVDTDNFLIPSSEIEVSNHGVEICNDTVCPICKKNFSSVASRLRHEKTVHKTLITPNLASKNINPELNLTEPCKSDPLKFNFKCRFCRKVFKIEENLFRHEKSAHRLEKSRQIEVKKVNSRLKLVNLPLKLIRGCKNCPKTFKTVAEQLKHEKSCPKPLVKTTNLTNQGLNLSGPGRSVRNLTCQFCEKTFTKRHTLKFHEKRCPFKKVKIFNPELNLTAFCNICKRYFRSQKSLMVHEKIIHRLHRNENNPPEKPNPELNLGNSELNLTLTCNFCPKSFSTVEKRLKHEKNIHQNEYLAQEEINSELSSTNQGFNLSLSCNFCPKSFSTLEKRLKHEKSFHENEKKDLNLVNRGLVLTPDLSLCCKFCPKTFSSPEKCLKHEKKSHKAQTNTPENLIMDLNPELSLTPKLNFSTSCSFCQKSFTTLERRLKHEKKEHQTPDLVKEKLNLTPNLSIGCNYCPKSFSTVEKRLKHEKKDHKIKIMPPENLNLELSNPQVANTGLANQELNSQEVKTSVKLTSPCKYCGNLFKPSLKKKHEKLCKKQCKKINCALKKLKLKINQPLKLTEDLNTDPNSGPNENISQKPPQKATKIFKRSKKQDYFDPEIVKFKCRFCSEIFITGLGKRKHERIVHKNSDAELNKDVADPGAEGKPSNDSHSLRYFRPQKNIKSELLGSDIKCPGSSDTNVDVHNSLDANIDTQHSPDIFVGKSEEKVSELLVSNTQNPNNSYSNVEIGSSSNTTLGVRNSLDSVCDKNEEKDPKEYELLGDDHECPHSSDIFGAGQNSSEVFCDKNFEKNGPNSSDFSNQEQVNSDIVFEKNDSDAKSCSSSGVFGGDQRISDVNLEVHNNSDTFYDKNVEKEELETKSPCSARVLYEVQGSSDQFYAKNLEKNYELLVSEGKSCKNYNISDANVEINSTPDVFGERPVSSDINCDKNVGKNEFEGKNPNNSGVSDTGHRSSDVKSPNSADSGYEVQNTGIFCDIDVKKVDFEACGLGNSGVSGVEQRTSDIKNPNSADSNNYQNSVVTFCDDAKKHDFEASGYSNSDVFRGEQRNSDTIYDKITKIEGFSVQCPSNTGIFGAGQGSLDTFNDRNSEKDDSEVISSNNSGFTDREKNSSDIFCDKSSAKLVSEAKTPSNSVALIENQLSSNYRYKDLVEKKIETSSSDILSYKPARLGSELFEEKTEILLKTEKYGSEKKSDSSDIPFSIKDHNNSGNPNANLCEQMSGPELTKFEKFPNNSDIFIKNPNSSDIQSDKNSDNFSDIDSINVNYNNVASSSGTGPLERLQNDHNFSKPEGDFVNIDNVTSLTSQNVEKQSQNCDF